MRLICISVVVAALAATPALAITGGSADGDAHPAVGALVADGRVVCTGTLVSPTVVLTAGHCTAPVDGARIDVTFDSTADPARWTLHAGVARTHPAAGAKKDAVDLGVVVLAEPVAGIAPMGLASAEGLKGSSVVSVGYGYSTTKPFTYDGVRRWALSPVGGVDAARLTLKLGDGGPCFGDSGGPQLLGGAVVSVTSSGTASCRGTASGTRVDTAAARAFLSGFGV